MSKFKVGDKVICVKNTPEVQEGWVGYIEKIFLKDSNITARQEFSLVTFDFRFDELEVLKSGNKRVRYPEVWEESKEKQPEYTGGSSNYYKVFIKNPTTLEQPYEAECNDIIEALQMTFAEGNAFKAIWRKAKARQGVQKKGYDNGLYDSEKVVFFGERMVVEANEKGNESK